MGVLSVLMELKADPHKAEEALEGFKGHLEHITGALQGDFAGLAGSMHGMLGLAGPIGIAVGAVTSLGGALFETAHRAAEAGESMLLLSQQTGISTRELGGLKLAAQITGVDFDRLSMGFAALARNISPFTEASAQGKVALKSLGVQIKDTHGSMLPMDNILGQIADKFKGMRDGTAKAGVAAALFGSRIGLQMIPLLNQGSAGLAKLTQKAKEMGVSFSTEGAEQAEQFEVQLKMLEQAVDGASMTIGKYAIPVVMDLGKAAAVTVGVLKDFTLWIGHVIEEFAKWLNQLPVVHQMFQGVAVVIEFLWHQLETAYHWLAKMIEKIPGFHAAMADVRKNVDDVNAGLAQMAELGKAATKALPFDGLDLSDLPGSKKPKEKPVKVHRLKSGLEQEQALEKRRQAAAVKEAQHQDELQQRINKQVAEATKKRSDVIADLTRSINANANAIVRQQAGAAKTIAYSKAQTAVQQQLEALYPMLTHSQIDYASTVLAGNSVIQQDILLHQRKGEVTKQLTAFMREQYGVQQTTLHQQFSLNQALFAGNEGLAQRAEYSTKNAAAILQELGMKKAYAAVMTVYEAALGFEALASYDFWKATQAFASSAMYAKVAMTSAPKASSGHGGGGGGGSEGGRGGAGGRGSSGTVAGGGGPHTIVNIQGMVSPDSLAKLGPQLAAVLNQGGKSGTITLASTASSSIPRPQA